jgi:hypothetical protein
MPETRLRAEDERIRTLVAEIVKSLVESDDAVRVELVEEAEAVTLRLRVADADVGLVVGKEGRTARCIRTILTAASMKYKRRYALDIVGAKPWQQTR